MYASAYSEPRLSCRGFSFAGATRLCARCCGAARRYGDVSDTSKNITICLHVSHRKLRPFFIIGFLHAGQSGIIAATERRKRPQVPICRSRPGRYCQAVSWNRPCAEPIDCQRARSWSPCATPRCTSPSCQGQNTMPGNGGADTGCRT
jgi:hypothetical protein